VASAAPRDRRGLWAWLAVEVIVGGAVAAAVLASKRRQKDASS
jgi:hypothetical protein